MLARPKWLQVIRNEPLYGAKSRSRDRHIRDTAQRGVAVCPSQELVRNDPCEIRSGWRLLFFGMNGTLRRAGAEHEDSLAVLNLGAQIRWNRYVRWTCVTISHT